MAVNIEGTSRIFTSEAEGRLARDVMTALEGEDGFLAVGRRDHSQELPRELGILLQQVLTAMAKGETVTISSIPQELTTSEAASMLGISRPTLMKLIDDGDLPSHKVGSHHRIRSGDLMAFRRARRERERAAFQRLLELEGDQE